MKKSMILVGMLAIGYANAQEGVVGINTSEPKATLDIQPNATNLAGTTNEGIIAPRLSKTRIADIEASKLTEGTLVYATDEATSPISAYTGTDAKVSKITEKGYYFYNGTEWVKSGNNTEWVYDATTKRINLKRSGQTTGFTNKVYYKANGSLINTDADTFYPWWIDTSLTNIADVNYNILHRLSQNITPYHDNINGHYHKLLSYDHLEVNEKSLLGGKLLPSASSSHLRISPDNVNPIYWASAVGAVATKLDKVNTDYIMANTGSLILLDGTVSGYATAGRFETFVNTPNKQEGNAMGVVAVVDTGEKMISSIKNIIGVNTYIQFDNTTAGNTVDEKTALFQGHYNFKNKQPKIPTLAGFYYDGVAAEAGGLDRVDAHYGIYLANVDRAQKNYAIYSNAGKVRVGDLADTSATADRAVVVDKDGVLKTGSAVNIPAVQVGSTTGMTCNDANRGKMNFVKDVTIGSGTGDAFAVCLKGTDGNFYWRYLYGAGGVTNLQGDFGTGLQ